MTDHQQLDDLTKIQDRRSFLARLWMAGVGLVASAGAWTSLDFLWPGPTVGFGGRVRTVPPESVPERGVVEVLSARAFLTRVDGEIVALSEKCTHLGCRVPYCESSSRFECPCHGSVFNRAGDYLAGPAPRGMDRYPVEVGDDGLLYIDTGQRTDGPEPGSLQIDEPATGPACAAEGH
jgi:cytochrome b6-f complex iron-sulfur subunit